MSKDWRRWHDEYDEPGSPLADRLAGVHRDLRRALAEAPRDEAGTVRLVSICAGEGRDVLPVLAGTTGVRALLLELDAVLAGRARAAAADLDLTGVEVRIADAGSTDAYLDEPPAHIVVACGVFGNVPSEDARRIVDVLPALLADGGIVVWTRSNAGPRRKSAARS